jgi:hypothetical protein
VPIPVDLSYKPNVLYRTSIERMVTARVLLDIKPVD